eukprot:gene25515-biopygen15040
MIKKIFFRTRCTRRPAAGAPAARASRGGRGAPGARGEMWRVPPTPPPPFLPAASGQRRCPHLPANRRWAVFDTPGRWPPCTGNGKVARAVPWEARAVNELHGQRASCTGIVQKLLGRGAL